EFGIEPRDIHWRTGGQEEPGRDERTPLKLGGNIDLQPIAAGKTVKKMFGGGGLGGGFSATQRLWFVQRAPNSRLWFPELSGSRNGILQALRHVSDHASDRNPKDPRRAISLAADHRLQSVLSSQEDSNRSNEGDVCHKGHAALAGGVRARCYPTHGRRFLALWRRRERAGHRNAGALFIRTGARDTKAQRRRNLPSVRF